MVRHTILVDTDYRTGRPKNPYRDKKARKQILEQRDSIYRDGILKSVRTLNKKAFLGYLFIKLELIILSLALIGLSIKKFSNFNSIGVTLVSAFSLVFVLWAIGRLPFKLRTTIKLTYFRVHILLFTGVLGSGGYFWAKEQTLFNINLGIPCAIGLGLVFLFFHSPFIKKENILKF